MQANTITGSGQASNTNALLTENPYVYDDDASTEEEEGHQTGTKFRKPALRPMSSSYWSREDIGDLGIFTERYNLWAAVLGDTATSSMPWTRAQRAIKTRRKIDKLLRKLHYEIDDFKHQVCNFNLGVSCWADEKWYRHVEDLADYDPDELAAAIDGNDEVFEVEWLNIKDVDDFVDYFEEMVQRSAARRDARQIGTAYLRNIEQLIRAVGDLSEQHRPVANFELRMWTLKKSYVLRWDSPRIDLIDPHNLSGMHDRANETIWDILSDENSVDKTSDLYVKHWNYAASFRPLWSVWDEEQRGSDGEPWKQEFRRRSAKVLRRLHKLALKEIRSNTALALGNVASDLPVELQEMIFEFTMEAEGVPVVLPRGVKYGAVHGIA